MEYQPLDRSTLLHIIRGSTMSQSGKIVPSMGGTPIETITGNSGGAVSPQANNVLLLGSGTVSVTGNPGTHTLTVSNSGSVPAQFTADVGIATPAANNLNIIGVGGGNITTTGAVDTITVNLLSNLNDIESITMVSPGDIQTSVVIGDTLKFNAYDTGTSTYTTFSTLTAGATPTMDLADTVTKATKYIYREDGVDVAPKDGGLGTSSLPVDGSIPIGVTATNTYTPATLTAGAGVGIANAPGSITISAGASVPTTFNTDAGAATPALNILQVLGGTNVGTTGAGSTVTVNLDSSLTGIDNITTTTGAALRTGVVAGNTTLLQAYNNTGASYSTFGTLTAGLTPTFDLAGSTTIGTAYPYRVGGNDVSIADGGTSLSTLPTDGQLLVGNTAGNNYVLATLTPGTGIGVANAGGSITISGTAAVPLSFPTDSGTATPAVNALTVSGGTNLNSAGAASTVTLNLDSALTAIDSITTTTGGSLRTGTSAGNTTLLRAYDVDGVAYKTFATLTANNTPTMDLDTAVTIGTAYPYRAGGTDVAVADGGTGVSTAPTNGQLLIGSTGVGYTVASLTAGANITITPGAGSISIAAASGGPTWSEETGSTIAVLMGHAYICNRGTLITATLPATATIGTVVQFVGKGAGLYTIAQRAGQTIHYDNVNTTTGVGGSLTATNQYDCIEMVCTVADTDFTVMNSVGNFTHV